MIVTNKNFYCLQLFTRAGVPTAIAYSGISELTNDWAPITAWSFIFAPFQDHALCRNPDIFSYFYTILCCIHRLFSNQSVTCHPMIGIYNITLGSNTCIRTNFHTVTGVNYSADANINIITYLDVSSPKVTTGIKRDILSKLYISSIYINFTKNPNFTPRYVNFYYI